MSGPEISMGVTPSSLREKAESIRRCAREQMTLAEVAASDLEATADSLEAGLLATKLKPEPNAKSMREIELARQEEWAERVKLRMKYGGGRGQLSYKWFCETYHCCDPADLSRWLNHSGTSRSIPEGSAIDTNIRRALADERAELEAVAALKAEKPLR